MKKSIFHQNTQNFLCHFEIVSIATWWMRQLKVSCVTLTQRQIEKNWSSMENGVMCVTFYVNWFSGCFRQLISIPRQRVDLLPLWSRFIAILNPVIPEVGSEVVDYLRRELGNLLRRCHPTFIESKLKVARFIAELVNFEVFPQIEAFMCLRRLLLNFTQHQLEMACAFIECCGRYLYKNPATKRRMKLYMVCYDARISICMLFSYVVLCFCRKKWWGRNKQKF